MEAVVFGLGQVAAQVSAAQVPRLWTGWPLGCQMFGSREGAEHYQSASGFPPTPSTKTLHVLRLGKDPPPFSPQQPKGRCKWQRPVDLHCAGCWLGVGPQLPHGESLGSPQPPPAPPPPDPTRVGVFASELPSVWMEDHIPRQVSLWISLLNV